MKLNMRQIIKKMVTSLVMAVIMIQAFIVPAFATVTTADITSRINGATTIIQGVLTGIVGGVAIIIAIFTTIKKMPSADNPQEKHELFSSLGRILGLAALSAAVIWIVPWLISIFTF